MTSDDNDDNQGVVWAILIGVILLAISLAVGMGPVPHGQGVCRRQHRRGRQHG